MNEPVDVNSLVLTQDEPTSADVNAPSQPPAVMQPVDIDSLSLGTYGTQAKLVLNPPTPLYKRITDFALNPVAESARMAGEIGAVKGQEDFNAIEFLPLADDTNKSRDSGIISSLTGIPQADVETHYDALKALYHLTNPAQIGADIGARVQGETAKGIFNLVMTPAVVAGIVAEPPLAIARLIGFTALDHALNLNQYIPKNATKNERASLELLNAVAVGVATGGIEYGIKEGVDITTNPFRGMEGKGAKGSLGDLAMGDVLEKYAYQKLQEQGLPDVITLAPDAVDKINQMDAQKRISLKNDVRRQRMVDDLASKLMDNDPMPENVAPEIIRDAKQQVVDQINAKEAAGEKIRNREQQVRADLKKQLAQEPTQQTTLGTLGVDQKTAETASANKLGVKIKAEKLVKVAVQDPQAFGEIQVILAEKPKEGASTPESGQTPLETPKKGVEQPITAPETGSGKVSGVSSGIEAAAIEAKLTKEGFADKAEYGGTTVKEQAALVSDLMKSDIEKAKRIATGKENAPAGLRTEALFSVMKDYAMDTKDGKLAMELAQSPVASEISAAGSKLSLSGVSDPNSATAKIREVMKEKEARAEKRLKGKTPEKAQADIKERMKKAIDKAKPKKYDLLTLLESIKC